MAEEWQEDTCRFVRGLPASLWNLRTKDAAYLVGNFQQPHCLDLMSTLEVQAIWEKIVPTTKSMYTTAQFALRLWQTITILFQLDKLEKTPPLESLDQDIKIWLDALKSFLLVKPEDKWKQPKLSMEKRW